MPYNVPTLKQLIASGVVDIEASIDDVLPKLGVEQALNIAVSASVRDLYDFQSWIVRQIIPTSESEEQTIIDIARTEGVIRKVASGSVGPVTFSGTNPIPVDTVMTHQDGRSYRVTSSEEPSNGSVIVEVASEDVGEATNMAAGEVLTLSASVPGVQPAGVSGVLSGGAELEPVDEVLDRLLFRKRNPPMGGAPHDYVAWCREVSGVSRAWCEDAYQGGSTIGYAFVFDAREDILPNVTDQQTMTDYIYRHQDPATGLFVGRPGGIEAIYIPLVLKTTDLAIQLTPDSDENRQAVETNLKGYWRTLSPGSTVMLSKVRTAIGQVDGIDDYDLSLAADITAESNELHELGVISWDIL